MIFSIAKHFHTRCVDAGEPVSSDGSCEPLPVSSTTVVASTTETTQPLEPVSEMPSDQETEPAPINETGEHKLGEIRSNQPSSDNSDEITGLQEQVPSRDAASVHEEQIVGSQLIPTKPSSNYSDSITRVQEKVPPTDSNGTLHDKKNPLLKLFGAFFSAKRFRGNLDKNGTLKVPLLETKGPEVHDPVSPLLSQSPGVTGENEGISSTGEMFMKATIKNYMNDMLCHVMILHLSITSHISFSSFISYFALWVCTP